LLALYFRSPPRPPGGPPQHYHDRHPPPMPAHHVSPHMRHDYRDRRDPGGDRGRHERDYRDKRMNDHRLEYFKEHTGFGVRISSFMLVVGLKYTF